MNDASLGCIFVLLGSLCLSVAAGIYNGSAVIAVTSFLCVLGACALLLTVGALAQASNQ